MANTAPQLSMYTPVRFYAAERDVFRKKERIKPSEWAEKYRRVNIGAHVGPWRNEISPYLPFIMDTWAKPHVREVVLCKSPQTGGTEVMFNCEAYSIDRDPATVMFIMPNRERARDWARDRIIPMIEQSPRLKKHISADPDDMAAQRIALRNGEKIFMAWTNSATALSGWPIKRLYFDETDKYPVAVGKETDPISLGEKRARTFRYTHKIFKTSSPTREEAPIWKALKRAEVEYHFFAECPQCSAPQEFIFDALRYPEKITAEEIRRENLAAYECRACKARWTDRQKDSAVKHGKWRRVRGKDILRPRSVGFHLPSWLSPDVSLSEIAAEYILSRTDREKLINFHNDYLAEPFIESEEGESVDAEVLYARRRDYAPTDALWQVPQIACVLTSFTDVQENRLETEVVGWGPGYETCGIEHKVFPGDTSIELGFSGSPWTELVKFLSGQWTHESGAALKVAASGIDSGYRADVVYRFVRRKGKLRVNNRLYQLPRLYACKGASTRGKPLISVTSPKKYKKQQVKDKYRVTPIIIGTEAAKDMLLSWMEEEHPGPGYMHYHTGYSLDYFRQLTAEHAVTRFDKKGKAYREWKLKRQGARNEALDLRVGNYAVLELLNPEFEKIAEGLKTAVQTESKKQKDEDKKMPPPKRSRVTGRKKGGYINGWR